MTQRETKATATVKWSPIRPCTESTSSEVRDRKAFHYFTNTRRSTRLSRISGAKQLRKESFCEKADCSHESYPQLQWSFSTSQMQRERRKRRMYSLAPSVTPQFLILSSIILNRSLEKFRESSVEKEHKKMEESRRKGRKVDLESIECQNIHKCSSFILITTTIWSRNRFFRYQKTAKSHYFIDNKWKIFRFINLVGGESEIKKNEKILVFFVFFFVQIELFWGEPNKVSFATMRFDKNNEIYIVHDEKWS